jgi:hypothetical protein
MMPWNENTLKNNKPLFQVYITSDEENFRRALHGNVLDILSDTIGSNHNPLERFYCSSTIPDVQGQPFYILTENRHLTLALEVKIK